MMYSPAISLIPNLAIPLLSVSLWYNTPFTLNDTFWLAIGLPWPSNVCAVKLLPSRYFMFKFLVINVSDTLTLFPILNPSTIVVIMYSPGLKEIPRLAIPFSSVFFCYFTPLMLKVTSLFTANDPSLL